MAPNRFVKRILKVCLVEKRGGQLEVAELGRLANRSVFSRLGTPCHC